MSSDPNRSSTPTRVERQDGDADTKLRVVRALSSCDAQAKEQDLGPSGGDHDEDSNAVQVASIAPHHQPTSQTSRSASPPTTSRQVSDVGSSNDAQWTHNPPPPTEDEIWDALEALGEELLREWIPNQRTGPGRSGADALGKRPAE